MAGNDNDNFDEEYKKLKERLLQGDELAQTRRSLKEQKAILVETEIEYYELKENLQNLRNELAKMLEETSFRAAEYRGRKRNYEEMEADTTEIKPDPDEPNPNAKKLEDLRSKLEVLKHKAALAEDELIIEENELSIRSKKDAIKDLIDKEATLEASLKPLSDRVHGLETTSRLLLDEWRQDSVTMQSAHNDQSQIIDLRPTCSQSTIQDQQKIIADLEKALAANEADAEWAVHVREAELMPLYHIGKAVRMRWLDLEESLGVFGKDISLIANDIVSQRDQSSRRAHSLAEASWLRFFQPFVEDQYQEYREAYIRVYGASPELIWAYRNTCELIQLCDWRADMEYWHSTCKDLPELHKTLFGRTFDGYVHRLEGMDARELPDWKKSLTGKLRNECSSYTSMRNEYNETKRGFHNFNDSRNRRS